MSSRAESVLSGARHPTPPLLCSLQALAGIAADALRLGCPAAAWPAAEQSLESAGGADTVDATQKGVSLARNALAVSAKNLAEQELAAAFVALEEHAEPRWVHLVPAAQK